VTAGAPAMRPPPIGPDNQGPPGEVKPKGSPLFGCGLLLLVLLGSALAVLVFHRVVGTREPVVVSAEPPRESRDVYAQLRELDRRLIHLEVDRMARPCSRVDPPEELTDFEDEQLERGGRR